LAKAITSVDGAKIVTAPQPGSGKDALTLAVVELGGKATLGSVISAVEAAKTPHRSTTAPGVTTALAGKVKPTATPEAIQEALKKADLLETSAAAP
jgi:hypothetical protein